MRLAGIVSMNVSVGAPGTHRSTQQAAPRAPPRARPGTQPSQWLLPARRRALRPATLNPTPPARTTACPPTPAIPTDPNAPGAASHAPAGAGSHGDGRRL